MRIMGFTGSRKGMNDKQRAIFAGMLAVKDEWVLHHGDCVGADTDAHRIAMTQVPKIVLHPPEDPKLRALCHTFCQPCDIVVLPEKPYIERNHDIVDACDVLVAAPSGPEIMRSGTWATVRYARKLGKIVIVLPFPE